MSETKVKNREAILDLAKIYVEKQTQIQEIEQELKTIKEELLGLLEEDQIQSLNTEKASITVQYPHSFDHGLLGVKYPDLYKKYTSIEKVVKEKVVVDKKNLERFYPNEYNECLVDLTPRLTIKFF